MLCPSCGIDVGDNVALCPRCAKEREDSAAPANVAERKAGSFRHTAGMMPEESTGETHADAALPDARYAGFWLRFVAYLIDGSIAAIIVAAIDFGLRALLTESPAARLFSILKSLIGPTDPTASFTQALASGAMDAALMGVVAVLLSALIGWLYFALFESSSLQATPGKQLLRLAVTDVSHQKISFKQATLRHIGKYIYLFVSLIVALISILFSLLTKSPTAGFIGTALAGVLSVLLALYAYLLAAFSERKQALHDIVSECLVIRREDPSPLRILGAVALGLVLAASASTASPRRRIDYRDRRIELRQDWQMPAGFKPRRVTDVPVFQQPPAGRFPVGSENRTPTFEPNAEEPTTTTSTTLPKESLLAPNTIEAGKSTAEIRSAVVLYHPRHSRLEIRFFTDSLNSTELNVLRSGRTFRSDIGGKTSLATAGVTLRAGAKKAERDQIELYFLSFNRDKIGHFYFAGNRDVITLDYPEDMGGELPEISGALADNSRVTIRTKGSAVWRRGTLIEFAWNLELDAPVLVISD